MTSTTSSPVRLLCICPDAILRPSRHAVLSLRFDVTSLVSVEEIDSVVPQEGFHGLVLCHTVATPHCELAALLARARWPQIKVIALVQRKESCSRSADVFIDMSDGPGALLDSLETLFRTSRGARVNPASDRAGVRSSTGRAATAA